MDKFICLLFYFFKSPKKAFRYFKTGYVSRVEVCINHDLKVAYVINPKVASTSIIEALTGLDRVQMEKDNIEMSERRKKLNLSFVSDKEFLHLLKADGYIVFSFVRNPYDRAVSFYKNKFIEAGKDNLYLKPVRFGEHCGFHHLKGILEVFNRIVSTSSTIGDTHFIPQSDILFRSGFNDYDFIGHMETMEQDYKKLQNLVKIPDLKKINSTGSFKSINPHEYFSVNLGESFNNRFSEDFERFGYPKVNFENK